MGLLLHGDCILEMKKIADKSVDMILCDLPYGTTQNKWDSIINLKLLWKHYNRIIKDNGAIVLTGQDKFTARLILSNEKFHRYNLIWEKTTPTGFLNANRMPLRSHEDICIFYKKLPTYNPQKTKGHTPVNSYTKHTTDGSNYGKTKIGVSGGGSTDRFPRSVLKFATDKQKSSLHPTQKPVALFEYLIKTYSNKGDIILDNAAGSGTTGIACINTNRKFILIEKEKEYFEIINKRLTSHTNKQT